MPRHSLASQLPARLIFILHLSSQEVAFSEARPWWAQGQGWATAPTTRLEPTSFRRRLCNELIMNVTFTGENMNILGGEALHSFSSHKTRQFSMRTDCNPNNASSSGPIYSLAGSQYPVRG